MFNHQFELYKISMSKNSKELGYQTVLDWEKVLAIDWERVLAFSKEQTAKGAYFVMLNGDIVTKISLDMVRTIDYTNDGVEIRFLFKNEVSKFPMGKYDADRLMEQFIAYKTDSPWTFEFEEFAKKQYNATYDEVDKRLTDTKEMEYKVNRDF